MSYITLAELKMELGISGTADDALLATKIAQAQSWVNVFTGRAFEAEAATRYYGAEAVDGQLLHLDGDLLAVTTLRNGDADATEIPAGGYVLLPRNTDAKRAIRLNSDYSWQLDSDCWISVTGSWGYSATAPEDVRAACLILAAYLYRLKDSQLMEAISTPELGLVTISQGMPPQARQLLARYRRMEVA